VLQRAGSIGKTAGRRTGRTGRHCEDWEALGGTAEEESHWRDLLDSTPGKLNVALSILSTHRGVWYFQPYSRPNLHFRLHSSFQ
jgi:hypothetical protein